MSILEFLLLSASSDLATTLISSVLIAIALAWVLRYLIGLTRLPPGPWGLPFVGYIPWIGKKAHETFIRLGKIYGGVFSINLGGDTMVVLNDWPSIKATLVDQPKYFDGRPNNTFSWQLVTQRKAIAFSDGPIWVKQRKLSIKILRGIGMGKKSMEGELMETMEEISSTIAKCDGEVLSMESLFFKPILKLNWRLIASYSFEEGELTEFEKDIDTIFRAYRSDNPLNIFPWLRFLPPNGFGYRQLLKSYKSVMAHLSKLTDQRLTDENENSERDFIDHYLHAIKANNAESNQNNPPYNVEHLKVTMLELFTAGVDTINATCLWGFLYLASHPQVQHKVQVEMDSIVGRQRSPNIADLPRLPYLVATIMEIHRLGSVGPLSVPHRMTRTSKVYNYTIPKDTTCIQNIHAIHHDPQLWEEPDAFRPERFIDEHNNVKWPPYLMPFSIGPRVCIGQDLAEMILKIIFSCLLHRFTFALPQHLPTPTFEPDVGLTTKPFPYRLHVCPRKD